MYIWRKLSEKQRKEALNYRRIQYFPKHSPPHFDTEGSARFLITAACYEHKHIIGKTPERLSECSLELLQAGEQYAEEIYAWCLLPNHYHILLRTSFINQLRQALGKFHGRSSYKWNGEDGTRGRQVWHNCFERRMRSERHYFASLNYVMNNAVHHGYVGRWQDWPWSNAEDYIGTVGRKRATEIWRDYPVLDYGTKWDIY
jgi:putative transposase